MSGQVRRSVVHPTSLPFEAPVIARILLIILAELTLTVSARLRYLGNAGWMDGHDCSSVTVLGCALVGAIHPFGTAAPALTARGLARSTSKHLATRVAWRH